MVGVAARHLKMCERLPKNSQRNEIFCDFAFQCIQDKDDHLVSVYHSEPRDNKLNFLNLYLIPASQKIYIFFMY